MSGSICVYACACVCVSFCVCEDYWVGSQQLSFPLYKDFFLFFMSMNHPTNLSLSLPTLHFFLPCHQFLFSSLYGQFGIQTVPTQDPAYQLVSPIPISQDPKFPTPGSNQCLLYSQICMHMHKPIHIRYMDKSREPGIDGMLLQEQI